MLAKAGKLRVVDTHSSENEKLCVFETTAGDRLNAITPQVTKSKEAVTIEVPWEALSEERNRQLVRPN